MLIPLVNLVVLFIVYKELAEQFGKNGVLWGLGLLFLGFIFFPILAFGDAQYQGTRPSHVLGEVALGPG